MENIKIIDDFFCREHNQKMKDIINSEAWKPIFMKTRNNVIINNFVSPDNNFKNYNNDWPFWRLELEENFFFKDILKTVIEERLKKKLIVDRIYAVSQSYEQNSNFHTDYDSNDRFTFCYYINDNFNENFDGFFQIKIPNEPLIISILPINNRVVCFPSNYIHRGNGFNKNFLDLRICIAWKFIEIS